MKKVLFVLILLFNFVLFVACDQNEESCSHTYGEWTVSKEATCLTRGEEKRICSKCEKEDVREMPLGDHVNFTYESIDSSTHKALCECGYTQNESHTLEAITGGSGEKCTKCGYVKEASNVSQSVEEIKNLVVSTFDSYLNSLTGSVYFKLTSGKNTKEISLDYVMKNSTEATAYGYQMNDKYYDEVDGTEKEYNVLSYAYLKDGDLYQLVNGVETVDPIDDEVMDELIKNCSIAFVVDQCAKFYNEEELYNALTLTSSEDGLYQLTLDLIDYKGEVINVANKTAISFNVKVVDGVVQYVELVLNSSASVSKVYVEFKGLGTPTINYPESVN